jgi:tetratricopeptide (TPR) repeat protein
MRSVVVWLLGLSACAAEVDTLLVEADSADARHENRAALALYEQAAVIRPDDASILRRIAKQHAQILIETPSKSEKKRIGKVAEDTARRAVELAPGDAQTHLILAIVLGRVALLEAPARKVALSKEIGERAGRTTQLDPENDLAWHVLGRWNYELATFNPLLRGIAKAVYGQFPDATLDKAAMCFQKAMALAPNRCMHRIEYGRTLAELGKTKEAVDALQAGLSLEETDKDDAETKRRGRATLASLEAARANSQQ